MLEFNNDMEKIAAGALSSPFLLLFGKKMLSIFAREDTAKAREDTAKEATNANTAVIAMLREEVIRISESNAKLAEIVDVLQLKNIELTQRVGILSDENGRIKMELEELKRTNYT